MSDRLKASLGRYDLVQNLVGRPMGDGTREVVSRWQPATSGYRC